MRYEIPVLLLFFNRKDVTLQAFERIRQAKPTKLYLASDGARSSVVGEKEEVEELRSVLLAEIDWDCEVKTLFREENMGCRYAVASAIDWLFEHEERGIILEDDCVANASFFTFVQELLVRYKDDQRVGMIAGHNFMGENSVSTSYCFSKYAACWGWATWRRAWQHMDLEMTWRAGKDWKHVLINRGHQGKDYNFWMLQLRVMDRQEVSAWDYPWWFSLATQNQLCIFPKVNLITNVGFGENATHTSFNTFFVPSKELDFPLTHPVYMMPDIGFDRMFYKKSNTFMCRLRRMIPIPLKNFLKRLLFRK